jgi:photosystem II stability/assembly factor-like uncharacterized protein
MTPWLTPLALLLALPLAAAKPAEPGKGKPATPKSKLEALGGLPLRNLGPAVTSGRIGDLAVDPRNPALWYVAVASGGVWKTVNAGATWQPVFDKEGSYSIGCVTLDPANPGTVWVGTGENNSQRSVGYGDGVYRSLDGGKSWENLGLKQSEHIAKIIVDPRNNDVVFVAAQGPLWNAGGERGLYRTKDGGKTWKAVLTVDENTGVTDVVQDPRTPDVLYAASYQRRRHVWGMIDGGPGSAIWKSVDGGDTWKKLAAGLPKEDMGKIGLAVSPLTPGMVFATVEASHKAGGFFRSLDGGQTWEKRNDNVAGSAQYYQELFPDPKNPDRIYAMDTFMQVTEDGGKTWKRAGERNKHVDNHALWIDPANTDHLVNGNDGGVYETYDRCATWTFKANLPVTQFYRVAVDPSRPFYTVYGGTQDNYSLGGPSRTLKASGATNEDWFVTTGGDGFWSACDPTDPATVYSESQHGGLVRYDRATGEAVEIQPQSAPGQEPYRWNWDAPLLVSRHDHKRLYFAANKVFRSDNRGDAWKAISPDLTQGLDRATFKIMGKVWGVDAVARNASTSFYGNIVSLDESPKREGLLYAGTDDGLVQVSENAGAEWRKVTGLPGIPERTYVSCLAASPHAEGTVYAAFDNHKAGDYKPYALRSTDRGRTWQAIQGNLPERGTVNVLKEDPARPGLLYCGTEFGLYFSLDAGKAWVKFTSLPTIAVKDLVVQEREGDLVVATFGRGFYVLDDLTPLREAKEEQLEQPAHLFGLRPALAYVPSQPLGGPTKGFLGEALYTAANPPFGAVFTYHLKDELKTRTKARLAQEKDAEKAGAAVRIPTWDELRAEDRDEAPQAVLIIKDAKGQVVNRVTGPVTAGMQRVAWDLRLPAPTPIDLKPEGERDPWDQGPKGPLAVPGTYTAALAFKVEGVLTKPSAPVTFTVQPLLEGRDHAGREAFTTEAQGVYRAMLAAGKTLQETQTRLDHVKKAILEWPAVDGALLASARAASGHLKDLGEELNGDRVKAAHNEPTPHTLAAAAKSAATSLWTNTQPPTGTERENLRWAKEGLVAWQTRFEQACLEVQALEKALDAAGAPHTPGRGLVK